MTVSPVLDAAGRRRSPATMPGYHAGRPPGNKGLRYPADPPTLEEIIAVMRQTGDDRHGFRLRALIVVLWRAGLRIQEAPALGERDLDHRRGSLLVRSGKGGRRREIGMDAWGWEQLRPWFAERVELPIGPLFCVIDGPTRGRPWSSANVRVEFRRLAAQAGIRRRFAPHQLRHALAVELAREGVALNVIQRQLGHANLGTTSVYLQGIDTGEIIATADGGAPMMSATAGLRSLSDPKTATAGAPQPLPLPARAGHCFHDPCDRHKDSPTPHLRARTSSLASVSSRRVETPAYQRSSGASAQVACRPLLRFVRSGSPASQAQTEGGSDRPPPTADSKDGTHDEHPPARDQMRQVVRQALDVFARLLLEAIYFDDLGDQHVVGLTDGLSGHVRRPRKPPIRDRVQRPADDVAILRHQTLKVLGQLRRTQLKPHDKGRPRTHRRSVVDDRNSTGSFKVCGDLVRGQCPTAFGL
jgi:hypothetical protein